MSDDAHPGAVLYDRRDHIATVTLNRPRALNAINEDVRVGLLGAMTQAEQDDEVAAVILRGAGDRAFCVGADIKEFASPDSLAATRHQKQDQAWIEAIAACRKPTIAAIHGYCLGGGLEIALACDIRIAARDAKFGLPETGLGIIPGAGGTQRLPRVVGLGRALAIILTGEHFPAPDALAMGLIASAVEPHELSQASRDWAAKFTGRSPVALAYAKEAARRGLEMPLADGLRLEADLSTLLQGSADRLESAAAFRRRHQAEGERN